MIQVTSSPNPFEKKMIFKNIFWGEGVDDMDRLLNPNTALTIC